MALRQVDLERAKPSGFLISPVADTVLLLGSPLLALALTGIVFVSAGGSRSGMLGRPQATLLVALVSALIAAHLVVTFARTHGNMGPRSAR